jgi:hypothetical protein
MISRIKYFHPRKTSVYIKAKTDLLNLNYLLPMQGIHFRYHILFWLTLIIASVAALSPYYMNLFKATMHRLAFVPVWLIATYLNLLVLMPILLDKGKKWTYGLSLALLILVLTTLQRIMCIEWIYPQFFWMRPPNPQELNPFWLGPFIQFAAFISLPVVLSMGIREGRKWYEQSVRAKQMIAEQQEAELNYLKAQVNPHFLFNTLNNLYGLSLESSNKVPYMILKLSDLLSYSLYESKVKVVSIEKELNLITDFISLEKERYNDRINVKIDIADNLDLKRPIAPLLMLPLIENAFKHGVRNSSHAVFINIKLKQEDGWFNFIVENTLPEVDQVNKKSPGGLGIKNLLRRLELLYPNDHFFDAQKLHQSFVVDLKIKLNEEV